MMKKFFALFVMVMASFAVASAQTDAPKIDVASASQEAKCIVWRDANGRVIKVRDYVTLHMLGGKEPKAAPKITMDGALREANFIVWRDANGKVVRVMDYVTAHHMGII